MNKSKELLKNTVILAIGKFCTQFITLLLLPLYTYCLTTEDYGYIDLIQTYITFFIPLIILKLDSGIFRFLIDVRQDETGKSKTLTTGVFIVLLQNIISIIVFVILINLINIKYNFLIIGNIITLSLVTFFLQAIRGLGNNKEYSISSMISAVATITFSSIFLLLFHKNGEFVLLSSLIANISCLIFLLFSNNLIKYIRIKNFDKKIAKQLIMYSLPMIPNELSWWIVNLSDRTILSYFMGVSANAVYAVSCKISGVLASLFSIFNMSWQESASVHINEKDSSEFFTNVINRTINLFVSVCGIIIACLPIAFNIIIGNAYIDSYKYIPILLIANIFSVLFNLTGNIYIAKKLTKEVAKTTIIAALVNIIFNLLLIRKFGIFAAAISTLIAYAALALYRYFDIQKFVKVKLNIRNIIIDIFFIISIILIYYFNNFYITIFGIFLAISFAIITHKKLIKYGLNIIKIKIQGVSKNEQ